MGLRLRSIFTGQLHIAPLVTFRIIFGVMMLVGTARFMALGWVNDHYIKPIFHFKYFGFGWVQPLPALGLYAVHVLLLLAAFCVIIGLFYRISAVVMFICFTYTELIDVTYYLNHYYFVTLGCLLLAVLPAHRYLSIDVLRKPKLFCNTVPAWCINILKIQLAIVYIFAGLIKINYDWLFNALPLKIWLPANDRVPLIGWLFTLKITPYIFSWVGMLYDTFIVFFLLNKRTRLWAYFTVIIFHTLTGILFQIGVFPVVMIGATLIFFSAEWHKNVLLRLTNLLHKAQLSYLNIGSVKLYKPSRFFNKILLLFFTVYLTIQLLFPWRFLLYNSNMYWSEEGYRFGWRVMLMEKAGTATFFVKDTKTGKQGEVFNSDFLNPHQEKQMAMQPDMILQYAHFLGNYYQQKGVHNPSVSAQVYVTLNAKPSKLFIDSTVNLMDVKEGWVKKWWVMDYGIED